MFGDFNIKLASIVGWFQRVTGDITFDSTGLKGTLATVNSNVGAFTSANITVDAKGRVTAAANGSGIPTPGGVGSIIMAKNLSASSIAQGATTAGGNLADLASQFNSGSPAAWSSVGDTQSGTWQALQSVAATGASAFCVGLFQRTV